MDATVDGRPTKADTKVLGRDGRGLLSSIPLRRLPRGVPGGIIDHMDPHSDRRPAYRWFVVTGVVLILFALAHLLGHFASPRPVDPELLQLEQLLDSSRPIPGSGRSMGDIVRGMSLFMSLGAGTFGVLAIVVSLSPHRPAILMDRIRLVYAAMLALMAAISIVDWFAAPTSFIGLAIVTNVLSLWRDGRRPA